MMVCVLPLNTEACVRSVMSPTVPNALGDWTDGIWSILRRGRQIIARVTPKALTSLFVTFSLSLSLSTLESG